MLFRSTCRILNVCLQQRLVVFGSVKTDLCNAVQVSLFHSTAPNERRSGILHVKPLSWAWAWKEAGVDLDKINTHEALPYVKHGGRGPNGRIEYKHVSGGLKRPYFQVDFKRLGNIDGTPVEERILEIRETWWRDYFIALVARECSKRWIIATTNMKVGDIVRSHSEIPSIPVSPTPGDSHPLGALPVGTMICCVEKRSGEGAKVGTSAGSSITLARKFPDGTCAVKMSSKREMIVSQTCTAVVGQVSNEDHKDARYSKFGEKKWDGIKQRSGKYMKKTGRFGRKIRPVRRPVTYLEDEERPDIARYEFTKPGSPEFWKGKRSHIHYYGDNPRFRWHID